MPSKRRAEIEILPLTGSLAAARTIEQPEILRLSAEDQRRIAEALLNPPSPFPALKRAFARHRELFGPA